MSVQHTNATQQATNATPTTGGRDALILKWALGVLGAVVAILLILVTIRWATSPSSSSTSEATQTSQQSSRRQGGLTTSKTTSITNLIDNVSGSMNTLYITEPMTLMLDMPDVYIEHSGDFMCNDQLIKDADHTPECIKVWKLAPAPGSKTASLSFRKN